MKKNMNKTIIAVVGLILLLVPVQIFVIYRYYKKGGGEKSTEIESISEETGTEDAQAPSSGDGSVADDLTSGYLTAWDGTVVYPGNKYYTELIRLLDRLAVAPEAQSDDAQWYELWELKHSGGKTGITVYTNMNIRDAVGIYKDEEDFFEHCSFRISGMLHGESFSRCIVYGTELKEFQEALASAHDYELMYQSVKEVKGQSEGFEAYYQMELEEGLVFLTTDDQGRIVMLTDSDLTELNRLSGCNRRVRVYETRMATDEEKKGRNPEPQIVGKIEFIETF